MASLQAWFWVLLLLPVTGLFGQVEICDNGIDDNGNGLIDLNDPFCTCSGISFSGDLTELIPNPSFEEMDCCPENFSYMHCLTGWENGNSGTIDYMHTCGFVMAGVIDANLVPFPNGQGITGAVYTLNFKEYISTCLNEAFQAGNEYTLSFRTAFVSVFTNGQTCVPPAAFDPAPITLFGHPTCDNLTVGGTQCPSAVDPNWIVLGQVVIPPLGQWMEVQIVFTPGIDISAIMLGPSCVLPSNYTADCQPYILYDDLTLYGDLTYDRAEIFALGPPCDDDFSLYADVNYPGFGQWQWYHNGVAIQGQNDPALPLSANNFQSGMYQVTFSTADGCIQDSIAVDIPSRDTIEVEVSYCPGGSVDCAGQQFSAPGIYEVSLLGFQGCDSLVVCLVEELEISTVTLIEVDTCGPYAINVCGTELAGYGVFEITCVDSRGCDSIVMLDLRVLEPEAVIAPPGVLACDPEAFVLLDGSLSPLNPIAGGSTSFMWTGPPGGVDGDPMSPVVEAVLPGLYCLTVQFESNGVMCSSTTCLTISPEAAVPMKPLLEGLSAGCVGDTLLYQIRAVGPVPSTAYEWLLPTGLSVEIANDSTLFLSLIDPGSVVLCARTLNECGTTDSVCLEVFISDLDTLFLAETTCDPSLAGTFQTNLLNQYGCDSILIQTITLVPSYIFTEVNTTCDTSQAGIDTLFLVTLDGCDSIVLTQTNLLPSQTLNLTIFTCDSNEVGLDTLFLQNQYGCDSTLYVERIYTGRYEEINQVVICGAGVSFSDSMWVTNGPCDSLFITSYQYIPSDTTWLFATTCDPTQAGLLLEVLVGYAGCDSTVITQVELLPTDMLSLEEYTCDPSEVGIAVLNLQNQFGCDSVVTIQTLYVQVDTQQLFFTTCDATQSGVVVEIVAGVPCDTVRIISTSWTPPSIWRDTLELCGPGADVTDTLFLQNINGCDSLVIQLTRYHELVPEWLLRDESCRGNQDGEIRILSTGGALPPLEYRLDHGSWQQTSSFSGLAPGLYTITVRDARGCLDSINALRIDGGIELTLDMGPDLVVEEGAVIQLHVQTSHLLEQLTWNTLDPLDCISCLSPRLGPVTQAQTVWVTGVTAEGCTAIDYMEVRILIPPRVYIPTSFSPNADGINDVFSIYTNSQVTSVRNMAIYDRWGNALYSRNDLPVNDPNAGWDGFYRGQLMDPGVYVFVLELELVDGSTRLYKGEVILVR